MESLNVIDIDSQQKCMKRFLWGILIYSIPITLNIPGWIPEKFVNFIQLIGLILISISWIKLASWKNISSWYLRITISLLLIWELSIVCHGFIFNYLYLKEYIFVDLRGMQYLVPLSVFIMVNNSFFLQKVFRYIYLLGVIFIISFLLFFPYLISYQIFSEFHVLTFAIISGFTLLTSFYHPKKKVIIALIVIILALILVTILARRNVMLTCACFLLFFLFIIPVINKNTSLIKKMLFIFSFIFIVVFGYNVFLSNQYGIFYKITKRATSDTREMVFFYYFMEMSTTDFIVGKGINGTYFCPGIDKAWNNDEELEHRDSDYRLSIECGYLQLILNGGCIYLFIYLLILFPAIIKGLFFSRNIFSKACAILLLMHLIDMAPFGLPTFSFRYFLVWFCVAICFSKEMRLKTEEEMKKFLL